MHWAGDNPAARAPGLGGAWFLELWPVMLLGVILGCLVAIPMALMMVL